MSQLPDTYGPDLLGPHHAAPSVLPRTVPGTAPPPLDRTGRRTILLSASNARGGSVLRAFVEECLLELGRLPRPEENEESCDGAALRDVAPGPRERQRLRLTRSRRVRGYRIQVHFWTGIDTCGYSDFGPGPGWYWLVQNPNPMWMFSDPTGPYETPEEAWEDARCVDEGEE